MINRFRIIDFNSMETREGNSKYTFKIFSFRLKIEYLTSIEIMPDGTTHSECTCKGAEIEKAKGNRDFKCYHANELIELLKFMGEL